MPAAAPLALLVASVAVAAVALLPTAYLGFLALLAAPHKPRVTTSRRLRFAFLVPAHNEETGIAATVASLRAVDWPADRFDVVVVADNCSDATADIAARAGTRVLARHDGAKRGKGYALDFAFRELLKSDYRYFVVVDADSALTFAAGSYHGNRAAYRVTSEKMKYARMSRKYDFTEADRDAAMDRGPQR